ncbi:MAG: nitrile hydratase subunit beta, partial [Paracoccaceae bacterium]|nr:nitrile hydratase subunit beta [Paracoccaceae bacterium]
MDGIHDLGGKQGYGPVPVVAGDAPYTHDWELRMWALECADIGGDLSIDWFRHALERMVPADYLAFPYFLKWATTYLMLFIDNGKLTMEEVLSGRTQRRAAARTPLALPEMLAFQKSLDFDYSRPAHSTPRFVAGDTVTTRNHTTASHSRLPQYAQGRTGTVIAHHGAHLLPDRGAEGIELAEHLYTVEFT